MNKVSFDELLKSMRHFLEFPDVEDSVEEKIRDQTEHILLTSATNGSGPREDALFDYLGEDDKDRSRLKAIIALSGGSLEKLKRIVACWLRIAYLELSHAR